MWSPTGRSTTVEFYTNDGQKVRARTVPYYDRCYRIDSGEVRCVPNCSHLPDGNVEDEVVYTTREGAELALSRRGEWKFDGFEM